MKAFGLTGILLGLTIISYAQNTNQAVIDKSLEIIKEDLHKRGDYNSCVFLSEEEFLESATVYITEYAGQMAESEDPLEIAALAEEAMIYAVEQVVLQEGLFMDNFLECQRGVFESFIPQDPSEETPEEDSDWPGDEQEEDTEENIEAEKTEIPDFVIDFPTMEAMEIVDQVDNLALWFPEVENGRPGIIFGSYEELDSVKAFYLRELPDFFQINMDNILVMTEESFDFRSLLTAEGRSKWATMRSIWIEPNDSYGDEFPGIVKIEIHY